MVGITYDGRHLVSSMQPVPSPFELLPCKQGGKISQGPQMPRNLTHLTTSPARFWSPIFLHLDPVCQDFASVELSPSSHHQSDGLPSSLLDRISRIAAGAPNTQPP
jgi:hypothetical protein